MIFRRFLQVAWLLVVPPAGIGLCLAFAHAASAAGDLRLEIVRRNDGRLLWHAPVAAGDRFELLYRHSSDHTPVHDLFEVTAAGGFLLLEERFAWYGAGLEFHPSADISFSPEGTRVRLKRPFPVIPLRTGQTADHRLRVGGKELSLLEIAPEGDSLWIRIGRTTPPGQP